MQDVMSQLAQLHRPRVLMRAARIGAEDYDRDIHLSRLLGASVPNRHGAALIQLMELEALLNDARLSDGSGYNMLTHVEVMIAIVGEARALRAAQAAATSLH